MTKEERIEYYIESYIEGFVDEEFMEEQKMYFPNNGYPLLKKVIKMMNNFPDKMIEYARLDYRIKNGWRNDPIKELSRYLLTGEPTGIHSTYLLLKNNEYPDTTVSYWKNKGIFLSDVWLRTLKEAGYIWADLNMGLDNITFRK
jgi:hypothetical protein